MEAKLSNESTNVGEGNVEHKLLQAGGAEAALESLNGQYFMIDICANLTNKKFTRDLDGVLKRAKDAGVKKILVLATNVQSSRDALRLTRLFPNYIYSTAGIHPHDAKLWSADTLPLVQEILSSPECVAVGQCGLDFSKSYSDPFTQKTVFEAMVSIASEMRKPLVVYERNANEEVIEILQQFKDKLSAIVIHSFTGNEEQLQKYLSLGCYISLNGYIWKDKSDDGVRKILEKCTIPLDRLLVETDSPFMYPNTRASQVSLPIKSSLTEKSLSFLQRYCTFQRNEPCSLPIIIEMIAFYYNTKPEDVALKTTYSALKIFGLC